MKFLLQHRCNRWRFPNKKRPLLNILELATDLETGAQFTAPITGQINSVNIIVEASAELGAGKPAV